MRTVRILLASFLLVGALATIANAQSQDRDNPTPLASGEIEGAGKEQKTIYYYRFEGGPGEVTASLEAKTQKGAKSASIGVQIIDANSNSIANSFINEGLGGGREKLQEALFGGLGKLGSKVESLAGNTRRETARAKVKSKQQLVLKLTVDKGIETYTVRLSGAVEFGASSLLAEGVNGPASTETTPTVETPTVEQTPSLDPAIFATTPTVTSLPALPTSEDRDNPTPLFSNVVAGEGDGKPATYYYSFTAGPGDLKVTVDGTTDSYSTPLQVQLTDEDGKSLLDVNVVANLPAKREVGQRHFVRRQKVIMSVTMREDPQVKTLKYKIKLDGAVEF